MHTLVEFREIKGYKLQILPIFRKGNQVDFELPFLSLWLTYQDLDYRWLSAHLYASDCTNLSQLVAIFLHNTDFNKVNRNYDQLICQLLTHTKLKCSWAQLWHWTSQQNLNLQPQLVIILRRSLFTLCPHWVQSLRQLLFSSLLTSLVRRCEQYRPKVPFEPRVVFA